MPFVRNFKEIGFIRVQDNLLQTFRKELNDPDLKINALYEFECSTPTMLNFQKEDIVLSDFKFKVEFADRTASDDVKKIFDSTDTILIKTDNISTPSDLKEKLFGQGEKIKKLSKEIHLKSLTLAYKNFVLYDLENIITKTFVTELNENFSTYGLISFSGETKTDNKLALISPSNKLKFNLEKDAYKNKISFELGKVHNQISFSVTRDNVLNNTLYKKNKKTAGENRTMSQEIIETIYVLGLQNYVN